MTTEATLEDLERTAALLEGRLSGPERDAAIARLEADEGLREVFADLMRFRAAGTVDVAPAPQPRLAAHRWGWRRVVPLAAAAAIVTVVLLPRHDEWTGPLTVDRLTPAIDGATLSLPARRYEHRWDVPRGGLQLSETEPYGRGSSVDTGNASFRLGVRLQDFAAAIAAGDRAGATTVVSLMQSIYRLQGMQPAAVEVLDVARDFRNAQEGAATLLPRLAAVDRELTRHRDVDPDAFALGKWAAAGRLAAMGGGGAHAVPAAPEELLQQAERLSRDDTDRGLALIELQAALLSEGSAAGSPELAAAFGRWIDSF